MNKWIVLLTLITLSHSALAHEAQLDGIVNLQASASVEVDTDTMLAVVAVEAENHDPAELATQINKKMAWALDNAKPYKTVKVKGGSYTTHQLYNKNIFRAWRGTQMITLESKNSAELGKLIGLLQKKLLIKSLRYQVSKEKLDAVNAQLITQAIANFKQQAEVITKAFDKTKYLIQQININGQNQSPPMLYAKARLMNNSMLAESAPANLQPNSSSIQVTVNGSIKLIK
ncbi:MAG: putative secreted protein [Cycloclasticus sp.]|jgi:predicted secreted protein